MTAPSTTSRTTSVAPLKNVAALMTLIATLQNRPMGLPGLGVGAGPSGFGKTIASQYAQNRLGAIYIEHRSYWTAKTFCEYLLVELGNTRPRGTIAKMMTEIIERIGDSDPNRPLIIDEADKLVDRKNIELVRDIYETTQSSIILVGEELLPQKLVEYERVHNRVLDWVLFQPCDAEDTQQLADLICPKLSITADLLEALRKETGGRARRIATTLHDVARVARNTGLDAIDLQSFRSRGGRIFEGDAPNPLKSGGLDHAIPA